MRIIAGSSKGKMLNSPVDDRTRPTSDRAREGLFSTLESEFTSISGLRFLDLFCGTGAVGAEALSRGAVFVEAVESDPSISKVATDNFSLIVDFESRSKMFTMTANRFLDFAATQRPAPYDVIFMDPPYDFPNIEIESILQRIVEYQLLEPHGIIAVERKSKSKPFQWPLTMVELKVRSYGQGSIFYGNYSASVLP
jgi:16S rRNA (guanine966-N2)-methyltransferase